MSSIFISYSRREAPFVDYLETALEKGGHSVWLDYKSMIPGQPWKPQLDKGIDEAEILVLVISKESMASKYVNGEWQRAMESKRIILVLFEAVPLPTELAKCEWVDFRISFNKGMRQLLQIIPSPKEVAEPPPQSGFKVPLSVWLAFLFSMGTAVLSLGSLWTVILPYFLLPLPYRILKRDYDYSRVQFSLIILPFALFGSLFTTANETLGEFFITLLLWSIFLVPLLFFLLRSDSLQRRGKPIAARPHFANPYKPTAEKFPAITYWLDYAPQDEKYAAAFQNELDSQGHKQADSLQGAQATLVLVSAYKGDSNVATESQIYYPIILQQNRQMDPDLTQIQWIDMRRGLRNVSALAKLVPSPTRLLDALGTAPTSDAQTVLPRSIQAITFFLSILGIFAIGAYVPFVFQLRNELFSGNGLGLIVFIVLYVVLTLYTIRALTSRSTSFKRFAVALGLLAIVWFSLFLFDTGIQEAAGILDSEEDFRGLSGVILFLTFIIGAIPVTILTLRDRHHFWRWFPAGHKKGQ